MKKVTHKIFYILLMTVLLVSILPMAALAHEPEEQVIWSQKSESEADARVSCKHTYLYLKEDTLYTSNGTSGHTVKIVNYSVCSECGYRTPYETISTKTEAHNFNAYNVCYKCGYKK